MNRLLSVNFLFIHRSAFPSMSPPGADKYQNFVSGPMREKEVTIVPGIGKVYGKKLSNKGYDKAYVLFGQFLLLRTNEDDFCQYLKDEIGMSIRFSRQTAACLREWAEQHL